MARTTFQGPVRSLGGIYQQGPASVVAITSSTTLSPTDHGGRIISVGGTLAANVVLTLPAVNVTANPTTSGPGQDPSTVNNVGTAYTFVVETAATALVIKTDGTDKFIGSVLMIDTDSSGALSGFAPASSNDVINMDGSTTGGIVGSTVTVTVVGANKYMVTGVLLASGTVATPFADA